MFTQFIYIAFFIVIAESVVTGLFNFGKATIYDIQKIKTAKWLQKTKGHSRKLRARPYIDIVIYNHNNPEALEKSVQSILKQSYRKFRITIVDNNSTGDSLAAVRQIIDRYPKRILRIVENPVQVSRDKAILAAAGGYAGSGFVLVIDSGCSLNKNTLHMANRYFIQNNNTDVLIPHTRVEHGYRISGILQQVRGQLSLSAKKALRFDKALSTLNQPAIYRQSFIKEVLQNSGEAINDTRILYRVMKKQHILERLAFDEMVVAHTEALPYKRWMAQKLAGACLNRNKTDISLRNIILILQPFIIIYVAYVAAAYHVYSYLLLAFFTFIVLLLLSIASDRSQKIPTKLRAGFISLPIYSVYIADNLIAVLISPFYFLYAARNNQKHMQKMRA